MLRKFLRKHEREFTLAFSYFLKGSIQAKALDYLLSRSKKDRFQILAYHRIIENDGDYSKAARFFYEGTVSSTFDVFKSQIETIEKHFAIVKLEAIANHILTKTIPAGDKPLIALTFDDGYKCLKKIILPFLIKKDIPATLFLSSGIISGRDVPWFFKLEAMLNNPESLEKLSRDVPSAKNRGKTVDKKIISSIISGMSEEQRALLIEASLNEEILADYLNNNFLSAEDIKSMGHSDIEIGSHSNSHPDFRKLTPEEIKHELRESKYYLETLTGKRVKSFAMPFGGKKYFDNLRGELFASSGYEICCSTIFGSNNIKSDIQMLKRIMINDFDRLPAVKVKLSGLLDNYS